jgi:hypothetical protein
VIDVELCTHEEEVVCFALGLHVIPLRHKDEIRRAYRVRFSNPDLV